MHPYYAQPRALMRDFSHRRTARLERGQVERARPQTTHLPPYQQGIAMPPDAAPAFSHGDCFPRCIVKQNLGNNASACTDPTVCFLQGDHICIQFSQDGDDPLWIAPPVKPDSFMDVVAGEFELHRRRSPDSVRFHAGFASDIAIGGPRWQTIYT